MNVKTRSYVSKSIILVLLMTIIFSFTSCGEPKTFEEYINNDANAKQELDNIAKQSGLEIKVEENNTIFTYKYNQTFTDAQLEQMKSAFDKAMGSYESTMNNALASLKEESGIDGIYVTIKYVDKNDKEIYSKEFK